MPKNPKKIIYSEQHQILDTADLAKEFFASVLALDYEQCFVSDESCLSDFSSCGLPESIGKDAISLEALYSEWDRWIIAEIERRYQVKIETTTLTLVDLFNRIAIAGNPTIH